MSGLRIHGPPAIRRALLLGLLGLPARRGGEAGVSGYPETEGRYGQRYRVFDRDLGLTQRVVALALPDIVVRKPFGFQGAHRRFLLLRSPSLIRKGYQICPSP